MKCYGKNPQFRQIGNGILIRVASCRVPIFRLTEIGENEKIGAQSHKSGVVDERDELTRTQNQEKENQIPQI